MLASDDSLNINFEQRQEEGGDQRSATHRSSQSLDPPNTAKREHGMDIGSGADKNGLRRLSTILITNTPTPTDEAFQIALPSINDGCRSQIRAFHDGYEGKQGPSLFPRGWAKGVQGPKKLNP